MAICPATSTHTREPEPASRQHRLLLLLGLLVGFGLRLVRLGAESLWYDETVSVVLARKTVPALIAHTAGDIHPPGYYLLLHAWQALTHPTLAHGLEFLFAWPSLWFGLLLLPLLYVLGRRLFDPKVALAALWLGAIHPFHLWYSQEVRMYSLGAFLGLLCLWALLKALDRLPTPKRSAPWLILFSLSAGAGLYTLYYFLFLLATLNIVAAVHLARRNPGRAILGAQSGLWPWLVAQLAILLLWTPWLPTFLRQALDPPVPPWRVPWQNAGEFVHTVTEVLAAQIVGQSPPGGLLWPYALLCAGLIWAGFDYAKRRKKTGSSAIVAAHALGPVALIFLLTLLATPLYHVRYAFTYAPPLLLLLAAGLLRLAERWPRWGWLALAGMLALSATGSAEMWRQPIYRADDHRDAVATLARNWRPGDVILVNAGWGYTILESYWPTELDGPAAAQPPILGPVVRLGDPLPEIAQSPSDLTALVVRGGSVGGASSLGWGDPASDFFALSVDESNAALANLGDRFQRIWHYRIYDTVSDPAGSTRTFLAETTAPLLDLPIPGRDFARLQLFQPLDQAKGAPNEETGDADAVFGPSLALLNADLPQTTAAGETLYAALAWQTLSATTQTELAVSLRIQDSSGRILAQQDSGFLPALASRASGETWTEWFALPVPAALPPAADYAVTLVVYNRADGRPFGHPGFGRRGHHPAQPSRPHWFIPGPIRLHPPGRSPDCPQRRWGGGALGLATPAPRLSGHLRSHPFPGQCPRRPDRPVDRSPGRLVLSQRPVAAPPPRAELARSTSRPAPCPRPLHPHPGRHPLRGWPPDSAQTGMVASLAEPISPRAGCLHC